MSYNPLIAINEYLGNMFHYCLNPDDSYSFRYCHSLRSNGIYRDVFIRQTINIRGDSSVDLNVHNL